MTRHRHAWSVVGSLMSWLLFAAVVAVATTAVVVPRITHASTYTILTSSMRPSYPPGSLVVIRPTPAERIGIGDVVTYQLASGRPDVVTHRVAALGYGADGSLRFTTQGDANGSPDAKPVEPAQIRGVLWYSVPWLGYLNVRLTGALRMAIVGVLCAGLTGYALTMFVSAARARRRSEEATT